ncbi:hypothetical protein C4N15_06775 [Fusobacterium necrophorum subsp. funduliforme]|uniref:BRO family protein n=1 Tax=Fusobacterium necrophorum TaxID=859 RepID=UPI000D130532|nr:ORF6C domain-containing protein [Fusobacterium necrophorum]AVQ21359.1 hypothetical protein C4N15_06775 [Fusobacterium necrophorum subsp. funduliforme]
MNEITILNKTQILGKEFTIYGTMEEPLFLAKDIAKWIEHSDPSTMVRNVDEDEKLIQTMFVSGQNREVMLLTENGLYEVLMQSRKPIAKEFKSRIKQILKEMRLGKKVIVNTEDFNLTFLQGMLDSQKMLVEAHNKTQLKIEELETKVNSEITLTNCQAYQLQKLIKRTVMEKINSGEVVEEKKKEAFRELHRELKSKFGIPSYRDLNKIDYEKATEIIKHWFPSFILRKEELNNK